MAVPIVRSWTSSVPDTVGQDRGSPRQLLGPQRKAAAAEEHTDPVMAVALRSPSVLGSGPAALDVASTVFAVPFKI